LAGWPGAPPPQNGTQRLRRRHPGRAPGTGLRALARGRSNKEIASALGIGEKTVKTHVSNIRSKLLHLADRTQAAISGLQKRLDPLDEALEQRLLLGHRLQAFDAVPERVFVQSLGHMVLENGPYSKPDGMLPSRVMG
jgi:Bacterial regulatory proteins, luxR family